MDLKLVDVFLENSFILIYGVTFIVSMIRYPKYFDTSLKYFPIVILYTFLNECLGILIYKYDTFSLAFNNLYSNNYTIIYTIYNIGFFLYFFYLFRTYLQNSGYRTIIRFSSFLFIAACLINPFFQNIYDEYQYIIFFSGALILILCVILYIDEQIKKRTGDLKNNVLFWIALGLLLYHMGYIPIKLQRYQNELKGATEEPYLKYIHLFLILVMYVCFIIGFLRMKKRWDIPMREQS